MMPDLTQLEAVANRAFDVRKAALLAIAKVPATPGLEPEQQVRATIDGLIATAAMVAEAAGLAPSRIERKRLAETVGGMMRDALEDVREELAAMQAGMAPPAAGKAH